MMFTIGIDVGGTYTDLVAIDENGKTAFAKSPSTPSDQSVGVMAGLEELARRLQLTRAQILGLTDRVVHGTTVATNALLEQKGARVALLTTEGHRDVIEMREGLKGDRYDLRSPPPEPLVPRERRFGVKERLKANGDISTPLDDRSLADAIAAIRRCGATSVAVCFLHSYLNPVHEIAAVERLTRELPGISISSSSDVLPQIKEYERVSTTIVNAYVGPLVRHYLANLEQRLAEAGFNGSLFIILSHGGMAPVEEASRLAAGTVLSGPAGGDAPTCSAFPIWCRSTWAEPAPTSRLFRRAAPRCPRTECSRGNALPCAASTSPASRPAADRSPASTPAARFALVPKAQVRCRDRPATATAAPPRPSPTPMSFSAISTPPRSWADSARWIRRPRKRRSTGSRRRWACRGCRRPQASTG